MGTAKKTRTVLAKEKDKENRLRLANAELKNDKEEGSSGAGTSRGVSLTNIRPYTYMASH